MSTEPSLPKKGRSLCPGGNPPSADLVMTPEPLARSIIEHFNPTGKILDPCRGAGAFYNNFPQREKLAWMEIVDGRDFLDGLIVHEGHVVTFDWIITNPPYSLFKPFLIRAMETANNVVFLAFINHFTTKARMRLMKEEGFGFVDIFSVPTPKEWPQSGFQLAAVHIQRGYKGKCEFSWLEQ